MRYFKQSFVKANNWRKSTGAGLLDDEEVTSIKDKITTNRSEVNTQKKTTPGRIRFENNLRRNKQTSAIQELNDIERKREEFQNRKLQLEVEKFEFHKELELKKLRMKEDKMNMRFRLKEEKLKQKEKLAIYELDLKYGKANDS
ncbi:uncharacterized protein LOC119663421 [Teleopsis dalmanni]|uniref:uncharacterized protein LOC119663421 n=1 Tax=Teleopsis dalmanni TaxID=139649 RepID=UPI0018CCF244|nr:uncharacterized protein LOC119663421 [Teleopsis dalmanni]